MPVDASALVEAFERAVAVTNGNMIAALLVLDMLMVLSFTAVAWLFFRSQSGQSKASGSAIAALAETLTDTAKAQREAAGSQQELARAQGAMVEQLAAVVDAVRRNTEADVQRMAELRDGIQRMVDSGDRQVAMLAELRGGFQGISGLGDQIDAMRNMIESMKANIEVLMDQANGNPSVSSILERVEEQFGHLAREMQETRRDITRVIELIALEAAKDSAAGSADGAAGD